MSKYSLFKSSGEERNFWDHVFDTCFDGYIEYEVATKEDDDLFGVDVWVDDNIVKIGVQLKTSSHDKINVHYRMECLSGWKKPVGMNIYVNSPKLDYFIYTYPKENFGYMLSKQNLSRFWKKYEKTLSSQNLKEYPKKFQGECWKYYFQIERKEFEKMCQLTNVKFWRFDL